MSTQIDQAATLKAYCVGIQIDLFEWSELEIIAAESPEHAVRLFSPRFDDARVARILESEDGTYSVLPSSDFDSLARTAGPIRPSRSEYRAAGWNTDDDRECICCGLFPCGIDEFEVCPECDQCGECGHDDECPANDSGTHQQEPRP
jgi:hypothetical protein